MKRKLHNFNTMDFLFFLIAIFPLVFPLFCMLCSALATESTTQITFNLDSVYNIYHSYLIENILGLKSFNLWLMDNVLYTSNSLVMMLIECSEWYIFVYLLRMAFDFLMILPNIVHNFVHKIGGTSSD